MIEKDKCGRWFGRAWIEAVVANFERHWTEESHRTRELRNVLLV
jgi:hypothetical protein